MANAKAIIDKNQQDVSTVDQDWLDLQRIAQVELTSEEPAFPIEAALIPGVGSGWRAAQAGEQTIRLLFDELQRIRRVQLLFHEHQQARTQEFVLRWSPDAGQSTGRLSVSNITSVRRAWNASLKITQSILSG